jgi:hypothetical protein
MIQFSAVTDENGRAAFTNLPADTAYVSHGPVMDSSGSLEVDLRGGDADRQFEVQDARVLCIQVRDGSGGTLSAPVTISINGAPSVAEWSPVRRSWMVAWQPSGVRAEAYLHVGAPGFVPQHRMVRAEGDDLENVVFRLVEAGELTVRSAPGADAPRCVALERFDEGDRRWKETDESRALGGYPLDAAETRVGHLERGSYRVRDLNSAETSEPVSVVPGEPPAEIRVERKAR